MILYIVTYSNSDKGLGFSYFIVKKAKEAKTYVEEFERAMSEKGTPVSSIKLFRVAKQEGV